MDFFNSFIADFKKIGNVEELQKKSGYKNLSKEVLGVNHFLLKHFLSPGAAFKAFQSYLPKFNKTRTCKVVESGPNYCRIQIGLLDPNLAPSDRSTLSNWQAIIDGHVKVITGKSGNVQNTKSIFNGDLYDEFIVTWTNPLLSSRSIILYTSIAIALGLICRQISAAFSNKEIAAIASISILSLICMYLSYLYFSTKGKYFGIVDSLSAFQRDADERYKELQNSKGILEKSYQEGKLLETMTKEIQRSEELSRIFGIALESLCTKFSFKRSFLMLVDNEEKFLRTAAVFGTDNGIQQIWNYKVDVSIKRENPLVLSSVFHTGQSILISNIDDHKFQLNDSSKRLIDSLQTEGFAIVPIPSESKNWGVIIADKGKSTDAITRRDLVALQRVSQAIGLALDKKAKIDQEIKTRKVFQKFVPSAVIENTLGQKEAKLGGELKNAICLFLDIRNFTQLSNTLPSQITVEILNKLFDILQKTIQESGGVIDKFLGDGALVTWGAIPGSDANPKTAILAAELFITRLEILAAELMSKGLPELKVGIGIHKGQVIAGNIGSNERMEFTVIGQTVNIASRLEQLTKIFKTNIVISEELIPFVQSIEDWTTHHEVQVRGVDKLITVASRNLDIAKNPANSSSTAESA